MAPTKHRATLWLLSRYVTFSMNRKNSLNLNDDGLLRDVTVEVVSEARKAAFGCKLSNCLRVDLETHTVRDEQQSQLDSLIDINL